MSKLSHSKQFLLQLCHESMLIQAIIFTVLMSLLAFILTGISIDKPWPLLSYLSLVAGNIALILMAATCILSARLRFVCCRMLHGIDKSYNAHKWLGIFTLAFIFFHIFFPAMRIRSCTIFHPIVWVQQVWIMHFASLALIGVFLILLTTLNRNIRYNYWRWIHKASGLVLFVVILHWLTASPFPWISPVGLWLGMLSIVGSFSVLYKFFLYPLVKKSRDYTVNEIEPFKRGMKLILKPLSKPLKFNPGNFVFLSFQKPNLHEPHPFSIAHTVGTTGKLTFLIRTVGDFTTRLAKELKIGDIVELGPAYGNFLRNPHISSEVWIAGGVGIAPFLSWLESLDKNSNSQIFFYYFHGLYEEVVDLKTLQTSAKMKNIDFQAISSDPVKFLDEVCFRKSKKPPKIVYYCGPSPLFKLIRSTMNKNGFANVTVRKELFNFR